MTIKRILAAGAALVALTVPAIQAKPKDDDGKAVLKDLRAQAKAVESEAGKLCAYIQSASMSRQSHGRVLMDMKDDVNRMAKDIETLSGERDSLPAWEQQAFDKVLASAQDAATQTKAAIVYFNNNGNHLWGPEDEGFASKIEADAQKIVATIGNYLKYEKLQDEENTVKAQVGDDTY